MKIPYSQQFSPEQTPLKKLLPILRANAKKTKAAGLKAAIAGAFFGDKADPSKLAGNTLIALKTYGFIDKSNVLTDLGNDLVALKEDAAYSLIAKTILHDLDGIGVVETLKEMASARLPISLASIPDELRQRGYTVSSNSSDLSGMLGWLRKGGVLTDYKTNATAYESLIGTTSATLAATKDLNTDQILFLRAMLALNVQDWTPYNVIAKHAEALYAGEVRYNWKDIIKNVLTPLEKSGLLQIRKKAKVDIKTPEGRGGKVADVKPTTKFETEIADPLLSTLYRSAGFTEIRKIREMDLADIVADIKQKDDADKSGRALEVLSVRLCQMLDLEFVGMRETDVEVTGGGEVDAMLQSSRLVYTRWQVQCKVGKIALEAVAKEVGMCEVTLSNVILIVSTGSATDSAKTYRDAIIRKSNLNIIFIDGVGLAKVIKDNSKLVEILQEQARDALNLKPITGVKNPSPTSSGGSSPSTPPTEINWGKPMSQRSLILKPAYSTELGSMYEGDSLEVLQFLIKKGYRAKLIMTSPPFALVRKKHYGNEDSDDYIQWFEKFIPLFREVLDPMGSLVIDIGGAWIKGLPVKSVYQYKLLIKLTENGFYLAQEFYHYNPAKLPTPAEWVTVRRMRVKDAMNNVFWMTQNPFVDADNRRVLTPYSESMKTLLEKGYKPAVRPSGHDISDKFQRDNGGAIPPNLLQFSNTDSQGSYIRKCKEEELPVHPARYPQSLPDFFIKFLTQPGDIVLDPFAGSNVTGLSAESLRRKWISIEKNPEYVAGSRFRFDPLVGCGESSIAGNSVKEEVVVSTLMDPTSITHSNRLFPM